MGENSAISWTDNTFNPWWGCTKVGPGCDGCYAEAWAIRTGFDIWGPGKSRRQFGDKHWNGPRKWNAKAAAAGKRLKVFCASMADVFDNEVPDEWRDRLWQLIRETPMLDWQLVTKRIGNAHKMLPSDWGDGYGNVWIVPTMVNQEELDRDGPKLLALPARTRGLSIEPLIGAMDLTAVLPGIHWAIVGGESRQPKHTPRPMRIEWHRRLLEQCRAAGVAYHFKQTGAVLAVELGLRDRQAGAEPDEWPAELRVREFPSRGGDVG